MFDFLGLFHMALVMFHLLGMFLLPSHPRCSCPRGCWGWRGCPGARGLRGAAASLAELRDLPDKNISVFRAQRVRRTWHPSALHCTGCMCSALPEMGHLQVSCSKCTVCGSCILWEQDCFIKYLKLLLWGNCYCSGHSYPSPERMSPLVPQLSANMLCVSGKLDFFPAANCVIHFWDQETHF